MSQYEQFELTSNGALTIRKGQVPNLEIHEVDGMPISTAVPVGEHVVLLLAKSKKWGTSQNLVCLDLKGEVVWRAPILDSSPYPKEYAAVALRDTTQIVAHTWGGIKAVLDLSTGRVISEEFVK